MNPTIIFLSDLASATKTVLSVTHPALGSNVNIISPMGTNTTSKDMMNTMLMILELDEFKITFSGGLTFLRKFTSDFKSQFNINYFTILWSYTDAWKVNSPGYSAALYTIILPKKDCSWKHVKWGQVRIGSCRTTVRESIVTTSTTSRELEQSIIGSCPVSCLCFVWLPFIKVLHYIPRKFESKLVNCKRPITKKHKK